MGPTARLSFLHRILSSERFLSSRSSPQFVPFDSDLYRQAEAFLLIDMFSRFPCRLYVNEFGLSRQHRNPVFGAIFVVTVIAPICSLFDSDLYRQAEAFLLIDMFTTLVL